MEKEGSPQRTTLLFSDLYMLWSFARTLTHNYIEIDVENKSLTCDCSGDDIVIALSDFNATIAKETTSVMKEWILYIGDGDGANKQDNAQKKYRCPDCDENLFVMYQDGTTIYQCRNKHLYSDKELVKKQSSATASSIWAALRLMEERQHLYLQMAESCTTKGIDNAASELFAKADELTKHIDSLKAVVNALQKLESQPEM
jgi:phage baseplate assembly protein gpV